MPRWRSAAAVVVLTAVVLMLVPSVATAAPRNPAVSGIVYGSDGVAIPAATVVVNKLFRGAFRPVVTLTADAAGHWSYTDKANTYRFDFSAPHADSVSSTLAMAREGIYVLDVTLPSYGWIGGTITAATSALPLPGATVDFYRQNADGTWPETPSATAATLDDGSYVSALLPAGVYAVGASAVGYSAAFFGGATVDRATPVAVTRGASASASIALPPVVPVGFGSISGIVVSGAARTPVSGAFVWLYRQNDDGSWPATSPGWGTPSVSLRTAADGTYTSGPIPLGNYKVRHFTIHTGSQWWEYVSTVDLATVLTLSYDGQAITGIEGWFYMP